MVHFFVIFNLFLFFLIDIDPEHWSGLYKLKLRFCWKIANFASDAKKSPENTEFKEKKRETLIEMIDVLDDNEAHEYLLNNTEIL